ncbi:MAG: hypothetical protein ACJAVK_002843 [Akkermansiaceae bacterium]|jgi:hypothetical protein
MNVLKAAFGVGFGTKAEEFFEGLVPGGGDVGDLEFAGEEGADSATSRLRVCWASMGAGPWRKSAGIGDDVSTAAAIWASSVSIELKRAATSRVLAPRSYSERREISGRRESMPDMAEDSTPSPSAPVQGRLQSPPAKRKFLAVAKSDRLLGQ